MPRASLRLLLLVSLLSLPCVPAGVSPLLQAGSLRSSVPAGGSLLLQASSLRFSVPAGGSPLCGAAFAAESPKSPSPAIKFSSSKISETRKTYSIEVDIPKFAGTDPDIQAVNADIRNVALKTMHDVVQDFKTNRTHAKSPDDNTFGLDGDVKLAQPDLISVRLSMHEESTDLPHPSTWNQTLNYQLHPMHKLTLDSIFQPKSGYLSKLAALFRADITTQMKGNELFSKDKLAEGTDPKTPNNFQHWALTKQGLYFVFNQDSVLDYTIGEVEVTIPWAKLKPMLAPNTPVAKLAGK